MRTLILTLALAGAILIVSASTAGAQVVCGAYKDMIAAIAGPPYVERITGTGIAFQGRWRIELWLSAKTRTWTLLGISALSGQTCIVTSGSNWEDIIVIEGTSADENVK
jgi:hypothetical protein